MKWSRGTKLISATSPELGVGVVLSVDGKFIEVFFPDADRHLRLSTTSAGIEPIELGEGDAVRLADGTITRIEEISGSMAVLTDGNCSPVQELWPHLERPTLVDHLASSHVDPLLDVLNRVDGQRILNTRRRTKAANMIGARIEVVPGQVAAAMEILDDEVVRRLLVGDHGSGRMRVACMVVAAMLRRERAESVVIIAPHRRALRWLRELYQRFHQVFVHIDQERWRHVRDEVDIDANPFVVHPFSVISSGLLASEEDLVEHLLAATPQLAVVDEAHQAFAYLQDRLFLPLVRQARHALVVGGPPEEIGEALFGRFVDALQADGTTDPVARLGDASGDDAGLDALGDDYDETLRRFVLDAAERVEFEVTKKKGRQVYYFEYGPQVKVERIPGLREGARFLGTFDRRTALEDDSLDFFASGHPLVEGLLAELQRSSRGRVGAVRLRRSDAEGFHGLYLIVVEAAEQGAAIRLIPLMDASGAASRPEENEARALALYAALDMGIELDGERVRALMGRVAHHPLLEALDASTLSQAILVAVMDQESS